METIKKPWGYEEILVKEPYVLKLIHICAGKRTSLQYHEKKTETMFVKEGNGTVHYDGVDMPIFRGGYIHIRPLVVHRMTAGNNTNLTILEASTLELDDVKRIEDDFGRVG